MTEVILETRNLPRRFGGGGFLSRQPVIHAVNGVSLTVRRGETLAIVGESGCGKSTLARMLLRLIDPSAGEVIFEGRDLTSLPPAEMRALRAQMQFIFQDPFSSLNPRMTVETIVGEPLQVHTGLSGAERRARVAELLARVGLRPEHADRFPHEFSGGQRQRISIARALASSPRLLIGNEPVSALDVSVQAQIVNLLEDLKTDLGLTLVIIAHDLAVIRHMADRVAVMYLGEVVELAETETLFSTSRHPYTQVLPSAIPVPVPGAGAGRRVLAGDLPLPTNPPPGCRFRTRCAFATDRCRNDRPVLGPQGAAHQVACHHHASLPAPDLATARAGSRGPASERRFALWRAATNPKTNKESTHDDP